ncbi:hypothetical protein NL676_018857 [Syzygium grande]|nr:hypothetical protein NL676_018857 [Syzygium grande]
MGHVNVTCSTGGPFLQLDAALALARPLARPLPLVLHSRRSQPPAASPERRRPPPVLACCFSPARRSSTIPPGTVAGLATPAAPTAVSVASDIVRRRSEDWV